MMRGQSEDLLKMRASGASAGPTDSGGKFHHKHLLTSQKLNVNSRYTASAAPGAGTVTVRWRMLNNAASRV